MQEKLWLKAMAIASFTCHQKSERSFFYHGYQFPICARCTGLCIGYLFGGVAWLCSSILAIPYCILLILPTALDGAIQYHSTYCSTNARRCSTGILAGIGILQLIIHGIHFLF